MSSLDRNALKAIMKTRNMTARALSVKAGLGQTAVRDLLKNETSNPRLDTTRKLAETLNVPLSSLMPEGNPVYDQDASSAPSRIHETAYQGRFVSLPVYDVFVSGGTQPQKIRPFEMPAEFIRSMTSVPTDKLAILQVMGDSMMPRLNPDDYVIIDTTPTRGKTGELYAILVDGAVTPKILKIAPPQAVLVSENPAYPDEIRNLSDIQIIGRIVGRFGGKP